MAPKCGCDCDSPPPKNPNGMGKMFTLLFITNDTYIFENQTH